MKIKGIRIKLINDVKIGADPFGNDITEEKTIIVDNVLVSPADTDDVANNLALHGKTVSYMLGIPKGDENEWTNAKVELFGEIFETVGEPIQGIEELVPLKWHKKIMISKVTGA